MVHIGTLKISFRHRALKQIDTTLYTLMPSIDGRIGGSPGGGGVYGQDHVGQTSHLASHLVLELSFGDSNYHLEGELLGWAKGFQWSVNRSRIAFLSHWSFDPDSAGIINAVENAVTWSPRRSSQITVALFRVYAVSLLPSLTSLRAFIVPCSACLWFLRNLGSVPLSEGYLWVFGFLML